MPLNANKAAFRRFVDEAANKGNLAVIEEVFARDVVYYLPGTGAIHGQEGVKALTAALRTAFPDLHVGIEELISESEMVVARVAPSGTNTGEFMGNPPTGRRVAWSVVHISRFSRGKIVENRVIFDQLTFLQQLGLAPAVR